MRKILVTGLTGHLGKNLAKNLNKYFYIYSLQRRTYFNYKNIKEIKCDLGKESEKEIIKKIDERNNARKNKEFELADKIRNELSENGILIEDKDDKTTWKYK